MNAIVNFTAGDIATGSARDMAVQDAITQGALQSPDSTREKLYKLQASIGELPNVECPLQHVFAPGVYARTIIIPAGSVLVGKIHKHRHLNILSKGVVRVLTESGGIQTFQGPLTMVSEAGTKRAVYAITQAVWTTIHLNPTDETDLGKLEDEIIAKTYQEYEQFLLGATS